MCSLFEEIEKDGRIEGEKLGGAKQIVRIGLKIGWSETEILEQLQQNLEIPLEKAEEFLEKFKK